MTASDETQTPDTGDDAANAPMARLRAAHAESDGFERAFVYGVFVLMAVGVLWYVWEYGRNLPFWDDWEYIPVLSGNQPFSLQWLWTAQNEHRMPLERLVIFIVWRTLGDIRVVMVLANLVVAALALWLMETVRRYRGRVSYTDAFIPLVLLHWGMCENMIFAIQIFFVMAPALAMSILLVALTQWHGRIARVVAISVMLALLPMHGAIGLTLLPAMLAFVAYLGVSRLRSGDLHGRRDALVLLAGCVAASLVAVLYFVDFHRIPSHPGMRSAGGVVRTVAEVLSLAIGPGIQSMWPVAAGGVVVAVAAAVIFAAAVAFARPSDREHAIALLAAMAAFALLIVAVGYGRSGFGPGQGFSFRYAIFAAPLLCCAYLSISMFATDARGRFVRTMLLLAIVTVLPANTRIGITYGIDRADRADVLTAAIDAGAPPSVAASRSWDRVYPDRDVLGERLEMLRAAGSAPYRGRVDGDRQVRYREEALPLAVVAANQAHVADGQVIGDGEDPYVVYQLPAPEYVCGVRLEYAVTNDASVPPEMQVFWSLSSHFDFAEGRRSEAFTVPQGPDTRETTVWIYDTIDRMRIDPDRRPCTFRLVRATLLLRETNE